MKLENVIYCGDNLSRMRKMPDAFVDLCYIDPPFFSNKKYEIIFNDGEEIRSFEDRWKGGIEHYVDWMRERVFEIHRILKETGSFYLHCDWHASHHLRLMLDVIFGAGNFRNEIIWHYRRWTAPSNKFQRLHDNIFFYTKSKNYTFNRLYTEYTEGSVLRKKQGVLHRFKEGEKPVLVSIRSVNEKGVLENDVWHIPFVAPSAKQRLGYPTQKPETLLMRIISASSNKHDLVFDPFCGCGTTLVVAEMLERKWLGVDVSPTACRIMKRRFSTLKRKPIEIVSLRYDLGELKSFKPFEFQNWVIGTLGGTTSEKKVRDMGIDGYTFMERDPIQVKQSEHVGRVTVDKFETAIRRIKRDKGIIVGFSFTKDAHEEVARVKRVNHLDIRLMTVEDVRKQL